MALDKPYKNIPGTNVVDAERSRMGYHLNHLNPFRMSLMKAENREKLKDGSTQLSRPVADERRAKIG